MQTSFPWGGRTTGDCGPYEIEDPNFWNEIMHSLIACGNPGQGVVYLYLNELEVSGAASPVSVATGAALVRGFFYENDSAKAIVVPLPVGATRTDRVVLRASWAARTVRAVLLLNPVEGTGVPPAMTRVPDDTWEIPLARLDTTMGGAIAVTDEREWFDFQGAMTDILIPANSVQTRHFAADAATPAKRPNRTRRFLVGLVKTDNNQSFAVQEEFTNTDDPAKVTAYFAFKVPHDYASGLTFSVICKVPTEDDPYFYVNINVASDGEAASNHATVLNMLKNCTPPRINKVHKVPISAGTIPAVTTGDFVGVSLVGMSGYPPNGNVIEVLGLEVSYTADC